MEILAEERKAVLMSPSHSDHFSGFRLSDDGYRGTLMLTGYHTPVSIVIDRQTYETDVNFLYATSQYG